MYKNRLQFQKNRLGIKLEELGKMLELDKSTYGHYEKEDDIMPLKHLITTCDYLNVSLDYVFEFTDEKLYSNYIKGVDLKKAGSRLKEFRKKNKISQEALAIRIKNNRTNISGYEKGDRLISTTLLYNLCSTYKVSADYLVGKIDEYVEIN